MSEIPEDIRLAAKGFARECFPSGEELAESMITLAMMAERERCAKVCEQMPTTTGLEKVYAERIRTGWQPHS